MSTRAALAVLLCGLAASAAASPWTLRPDGMGPLAIGMPFDAANRALGQRLRHTPPALRASDRCEQMRVPGRRGLLLMFVDDRLARVDIVAGTAKTDRGVRLGDAMPRLEAAYPDAVNTLHAYDATERYLTWLDAAKAHGVRFETLRGKVGRIYAGRADAIAWVEGCN